MNIFDSQKCYQLQKRILNYGNGSRKKPLNYMLFKLARQKVLINDNDSQSMRSDQTEASDEELEVLMENPLFNDGIACGSNE